MDQGVFLSCCKNVVDTINENLTRLTERYCDSSDSPDCYTDTITPLLVQQLEVLKFLKDTLKP